MKHSANYLKIFFRGIGQVMLQENAWTGLLFLLGIFYHSWIFGLGAVLGNTISTLSAKFLKYPKEEIEKGLYGFNGTLVGIAVFYFYGFNLVSIFYLAVGAFFSSFVMYYLNKKIPAFTAPFVLTTWLIIIEISIFKFLPQLNHSIPESGQLDLLASLSKSFSEVMFQNSAVTGILFFLGILINSRKSTIFALYGSALGSIFAFLISLPLGLINFGLFGYNAILASVALQDKKKSFFLATGAIILSVLLNLGFNKIGLPALTAPFVLATWGILFIKNKK